MQGSGPGELIPLAPDTTSAGAAARIQTAASELCGVGVRAGGQPRQCGRTPGPDRGQVRHPGGGEQVQHRGPAGDGRRPRRGIADGVGARAAARPRRPHAAAAAGRQPEWRGLLPDGHCQFWRRRRLHHQRHQQRNVRRQRGAHTSRTGGERARHVGQPSRHRRPVRPTDRIRDRGHVTSPTAGSNSATRRGSTPTTTARRSARCPSRRSSRRTRPG